MTQKEFFRVTGEKLCIPASATNARIQGTFVLTLEDERTRIIINNGG